MSKIQKLIGQLVGASVLLFCSFSYSNAQQPTVTNPTFYDDTNVHVPLQFGFPFYGRTFTNSWMHSNGEVSFLDPAVPIEGVGYNPGQWAYCCGDRPNGTTPQFNYMIAPLWTDLYPDGTSTFRTEGTANYQKYYWTNLGEISNTNNRNTFSLEIRPSGFIGVDYTQINMRQTAWVGTVGNATSGQVNEIYYGSPGLNYTGLTGWTQANTPADLCFTNPLSSPTCSGYTEAMCAANPLYSQTCSGYQQAYLTQQCSANPLYNTSCPGYATAYLNYQCSINPLYSTTCEGYEQAYFTQQCTVDPLYNTQCSGYQAAYLEQQCTLNPLYSTTCSGYEAAYFTQQCTANQLYSTQCPGYQQAYFSQQCIANGLYDRQCPNYAEAYAAQQALNQTTVTTTTTTTTSTPTTIAEATTVAVIADPVVNSVVTTTTTSASPAAAATTAVPLVQSNTTANTTSTITAAEKTESKTEEKTDATSTNVSETTSTASASTSSENKTEKPKTARQELQERRVAAARAKAIEDGKNLANTIGSAASIEQQVAVQNVVIAAMGYTPGFDTYGKVFMPDAQMYKPFTIYNNQKNVDNRLLSRGLSGPSDRLHEQMVDTQYGR